MPISNFEKETIVNFNEGEAEAYIFTYNKKLLRKLSRYARENPELCELKEVNSEGGKTYIIKKDRLSINFKRPLSEAEKERRRKNAMAQGFLKKQ